MKIKYLGTSAAEGIPGMFCICDHCRRAILAGGKNLRTRSQALINDKLLIDFPPDTYIHVLRGHLDLTKIASCLITHTHMDHFHHDDFWCRDEGPAPVIRGDVPTLTIYGLKPVYDIASKKNFNGRNTDGKRIEAKELMLWKTSNVDGFSVTPLDADHDHESGCTLYLISDGEKTMLYGHDTGYFPDSTMDYLRDNSIHLDFVSLDCCNMLLAGFRGHMGIEADRVMRDRLFEIGCADKNTVFAINHFSHNGGLTHDELAARVDGEFVVAFDGMDFEF